LRKMGTRPSRTPCKPSRVRLIVGIGRRTVRSATFLPSWTSCTKTTWPSNRFAGFCALAFLRIGLSPAGDTILGQVQSERRLHSLYTAARDLVTSEALLEPFVIEAGALRAGDPRFANRRVLDAQAHADLLAEIPTLVSRTTLQREFGASRAEVEALLAERSWSPNHKTRSSDCGGALLRRKVLWGMCLKRRCRSLGVEEGRGLCIRSWWPGFWPHFSA
jgi:hypothetical protein